MSITSSGRDASTLTGVLLRLGVVVGPVYLAVGVVLALTSEGFDFSKHPLSVLMLGPNGWVQTTNLVVSGLLAIAAGWGVVRASRTLGTTRFVGLLVIAYGGCVVLGGVFPPDAMPGFPPGTTEAAAPSTSGLLHLLFGGVGFVLLGAAALTAATSAARRGSTASAVWSYLAGAVIIVGFLSGAVLPTLTLGVVALWTVVVLGWTWLAVTTARLYRATAP